MAFTRTTHMWVDAGVTYEAELSGLERKVRKAHFSVCCRSLIDFLPRMSSMRLVPDCGLGGGKLGPGAPNGGGGPGRPRCLLCGGRGPAGNTATRLAQTCSMRA